VRKKTLPTFNVNSTKIQKCFSFISLSLLGVRFEKVFLLPSIVFVARVYFLGSMTTEKSEIRLFLFPVGCVIEAETTTRRKVIIKIDKQLVNRSVKINGHRD
jgi:hypothetical protein